MDKTCMLRFELALAVRHGDRDRLQNDQLDCVAECHVHEGANGIAEPPGDALGGVTEQPRKGNDGNRVHGEDDGGRLVRRVDGDAHGYKYQKDIEPARQQNIPDGQEEPDRYILLRPLAFLVLERRRGDRRRVLRGPSGGRLARGSDTSGIAPSWSEAASAPARIGN